MYHPGDRLKSKKKGDLNIQRMQTSCRMASVRTERPTFCMRVREGHFPINCSRYTAKNVFKK